MSQRSPDRYLLVTYESWNIMDIVKQSVIELADIDYVIQIDDLVVSVLLLCTFYCRLYSDL